MLTNLAQVFQVFSRRQPRKAPPMKPLTRSLRTRVIVRCHEVFQLNGLRDAPWIALEKKLVYLHANPLLAAGGTPHDRMVAWMQECSDAEFLDALEFIFEGGEGYTTSGLEPLVPAVNEFFGVDDLPFAVTSYVWEESVGEGMFRGSRVMKLVETPRVIRKDSQVAHVTAVQPALELLSDGRFRSANGEFLNGLEDYRRGDYADCLTKCCSSFESVLKVVCEIKKWSYSPRDTAGPLLDKVITQSGLDPFFEQPLLIVATLRNRLSSSHGQGTGMREVTAAKAEYAINATAAAILLVVKHSL